MLAPRALNTTKNPVNFCSTYLSPVPHSFKIKYNILKFFYLCGYTSANLFHVSAIARHSVWADLRVCPNNGQTHRFAPATGLSNIYRIYWFMVFNCTGAILLIRHDNSFIKKKIAIWS